MRKGNYNNEYPNDKELARLLKEAELRDKVKELEKKQQPFSKVGNFLVCLT
jgi:hypothetical protein